MSRISALLDVGRRSLENSQTALQTVAHNIANKSTDGFSRQRVELMSNPPISEGNIQIGMGARPGVVSRINNPWLEKQIQREGANLGFQDARTNALSRVEQVYNEQNNKGLNQYLTDFFNSYRELSNSPESLATRTMVKESAGALTKDFKRVVSQLHDVQEDVDGQLITMTEEVNQMAKEVASLNEKIQLVEISGAPANDERDRRDLLLKKMGEKIDITWAEGTDGQVSVTAARTGILVSGSSHGELQAAYTGDRDRVEIFFRANPTSTPGNITKQITGGRMGGALEVRDRVVEDLIGKVDELAYNVATEVNKAHIEGFDRNGRKGVLMFEIGDSQKNYAENIELNQTILTDVSRIVAGASANAPGDNMVANVISSLQFKPSMRDGTTTFDDFYNSEVGRVGTFAQRAVKSFEAQKNIIEQLGNIRESISGVSLDEEATKMIEFQKAYDASARIIRVADEMFDTVLSLKRL